jgi:transposase-like protein
LEEVNLKKSIRQEGIMPKEQRTFTKEFKQEAVQLVQTSGREE